MGVSINFLVLRQYRGSIFTVLVLVMRVIILVLVSVLMITVLVFVLFLPLSRDQGSSRHLTTDVTQDSLSLSVV